MQHSRTVEEEIQGIDKILKQLEGKSGSGYEAWRRTQAVQKQKDNKVNVLVPPPLPLLQATSVLVCMQYSQNLLYGHLRNTDTSISWTASFVPRKRKPLHFL